MRGHVRVDGVWLNGLAPWGDLTWSTDERGSKEASFVIHLRPGQRPAALHRGALVEILRGPAVIWSGFLDEPDWATGEFHALGFSYAAETFPAIDGSNAPTSTPSVAVDRAIALGWLVTRGSSIPTGAFTTTVDESNSVGALLDALADELGQRWSVRADRVVRMEDDATEPSWLIPPGIVELGNASDDYASSILVTYKTVGGTTAGTIRTDSAAAARFGPKYARVNLSDFGPMTLARAQGYGDGLLAKGAARLGWTEAIEVSPSLLLTIGGVPSDLSMVQAGQVVRIHGVFDDLIYLNGRTYLDVVIGSTQYADGSDVLTIGPVGSVTQTLSQAISELTEKAA